jgi:acetylornithine deacetylase/succinyl-diaminopimelate desuccinylase-like protein
MTVQTAIAAFEKQKDSFLADLMRFLRFETISTQSERAGDMRQCAAWIRDQLAAAGVRAEILETGGHPAVFADTGPAPAQPSPPTFLFYGHYDVQPTGDASLWNSPPFEPTVRDGAIYARGSADDKGQVMTHLAAMRCWHAVSDSWPCRVKFLIEGEEEIGSLNLSAVVEANRDRLACDYVVLSDTAKHDADTPALPCSTRGLVYKQITVHGPSHDLHSGIYGGTVANPANALAAIIASFHDRRRRVTIPGFYDQVMVLSEEDRRRLAEHGLSDAALLAATGSPAPCGEDGHSNAERCGTRPTLDVNGLLGGYTAEGAATIIPSQAMAKISMRLVPHQDPARVSAMFDKVVQQACPPGVRLSIDTHSMCEAYLSPPDSPGMRAARQALAESFGRPPVVSHEGGTLPILPMFKKVLGADSLMLGFAMPDCNLHSPNEFFHIRDFELGTRCILEFLAGAREHVR